MAAAMAHACACSRGGARGRAAPLRAARGRGGAGGARGARAAPLCAAQPGRPATAVGTTESPAAGGASGTVKAAATTTFEVASKEPMPAGTKVRRKQAPAGFGARAKARASAAVKIADATFDPKERKPRSFYRNFKNLENELRAFVGSLTPEERKRNVRMTGLPTMRYLQEAGRPDLVAAIWRHGGGLTVAGRMADVPAASPLSAFVSTAANQQLASFRDKSEGIRSRLADMRTSRAGFTAAEFREAVEGPSARDALAQELQELSRAWNPGAEASPGPRKGEAAGGAAGRAVGPGAAKSRRTAGGSLLKDARKYTPDSKRKMREEAEARERADATAVTQAPAAPTVTPPANAPGQPIDIEQVRQQLAQLNADIQEQKRSLQGVRAMSAAGATGRDPLLDAAEGAMAAQESAAAAAAHMVELASMEVATGDSDGTGVSTLESAKELIDAAQSESKVVREAVAARVQRVTDSLEFAENDTRQARRSMADIKTEAHDVRARARQELADLERQQNELAGQLAEARARALGNNTALGQLVEVRVVWPYIAKEVQLHGSFNGWSEGVMMPPNGDQGFTASLQLYPGRYEIKFVVDGQWRVDGLRSVISDEMGSQNNELIVAAPIGFI